MKDLAAIFAIAANGVIGRGGRLPWDFPEDRAHFTRTTMGHVVIMGRRTWEETGEPLAGRTNIVVSRSSDVKTLDEALARAWKMDDQPFVIGGARLFEEAFPIVSRIFVTDIPGEYEGDTVLRFDRRPFRIVEQRTGAHGLVFSTLEPDVGDAIGGEEEPLLEEYFTELEAQDRSFVRPNEKEAFDAVLVAREAGVVVATGALRRLQADTFEVKRMFVRPNARGRGHGRRILATLERRARALGAKRIVLDTAEPLERAARLYRRSGYREIPRYNDNPAAVYWFEKGLP